MVSLIRPPFPTEKQVAEPSKAFDLILQRYPAKLKEFQPRNKCRVSASTKGVRELSRLRKLSRDDLIQ